MQDAPHFIEAMIAAGRSPDIPEAADAYGWLIGSWELDILRYRDDVADLGIRGEAHFVRVLEGRAVQDVWIMPRRVDRTPDLARTTNMYGTTQRIWDAALQAWRVIWINPVTGARDELIGRRVGDDLVQIGTHADGTPIRWTFTEITPDTFRWLGEALAPDGATWKTEAEFRGRRIR